MAYSFSEEFARNLAESIRRTARDKEYIKWALDARKQYVDLRLKQDPEIRGLYLRAAKRAGELIKSRFRWPSDILLRRRLRQLKTGLEEIAQQFNGEFTDTLKAHIVKAVTAGTGYSQAVTLSLAKMAGWDTAPIHELFAQVNIRAVEACWARTRKGLFLSDRIWQQAEQVRDTMRDIIQEAVTLGLDAKDVARLLEQYVQRGAKTLAWQYPNMMERMKGRIPKDLTYEGLRLARTEITAAFGEGAISAARVSPSYKGMRWILSKAHPLEDICDTFAEADYFGLGPGVYSPGNEPMYPPHPSCLCVLVPVHETPEEFVERLQRWRENPEVEPKLEEWYNEIYRKQGRITLVSEPAQPVKPSFDEILRDKEREIAGRTTERCYLFDEDGSIILTKDGTHNAIAFTPDELKLFAGRVFTHNHPRGSSFSPQDIRTAAASLMKEIRAVGSKYRYSMKPPDSGWSKEFWDNVISPAVQRYDAEVRQEFWAAIRAGKMTPDEASERHWHEVWSRVSKEIGLKYKREGW